MSEPLAVREAPASYVLEAQRVKPGYKQTEVGVIPEDWEASTIGENSKWMSGGTPLRNNAEFWSGAIPWISGSTLKSAEISTSDQFLTVEAVSVGSKMAPVDSTLLLVRGSALHNEIRAGLVVLPIAFNQDVKALVPNVTVEPKFLTYYILAQSDALLKLVSSAGNSAGVLDTKLVQNFKFLKPPLLEQRAIVAALSDADALIEALEQLIAKKRHLKQGAMQQLLTGKKRLPGFSVEWEVKRLGDVAEMGSGGTPPSSVSEYYDGDIPWVSISDMTKGGKVILNTDRNLSREGFSHSAAQLFSSGTVLYAMYASLGECSIAGTALCTSQAILGIRPKENLSNEYLYYYLTSLKTTVKSMGQQGTQANLNKGMVQAFQLRLPTLSEQTAIATILSDMDTEIAALEIRLAKTRELKQGMMQELLTGKIRLV